MESPRSDNSTDPTKLESVRCRWIVIAFAVYTHLLSEERRHGRARMSCLQASRLLDTVPLPLLRSYFWRKRVPENVTRHNKKMPGIVTFCQDSRLFAFVRNGLTCVAAPVSSDTVPEKSQVVYVVGMGCGCLASSASEYNHRQFGASAGMCCGLICFSNTPK